MLPVAPPSRILGLVCAALIVASTTLLVFPLREVAPVVSLGVVYLVAVLVISTIWGAWLGVVTAIASALAFNYFHIPPTGRFTIADSENWVALVVFLIVALIGSSVAQVARTRATEAEQRRREADLAAEMARLLLRGNELSESLPAAAQRLATALNLPSASIELAPVEGDERRVAFPLREGTTQLGTLVVPAGMPEESLRRLQERVVPSLEALLAAGLDRDRLLTDSVETRALRRADVVKTALLRAVSHDLRTPLTAIVAAGEAIASPTLSEAERRELGAVITAESTRLSRLIDNLLDLSRLEGGAADPRPVWCSIEEVVAAAVEDLRLPPERLSLALDRDLPLVRADAAQLERAFANLLENGVRHSGGHPVSVRARVTGGRLLVRIVDRGPGIPPAQRERVFEPFYRAGTASAGHRGSGLGLAIARGFVEANGGRISVESLPGQGTSFVVEFPGELLRFDEPVRRHDRLGRVSTKQRVLVCDDEPQILRALRVILRDAGFEVDPAETAREALDKAAVHPPHAAIIDLVLPDGDGIEVCRQLREWTQMPIIVLSAVGEEEQKVRALEAGRRRLCDQAVRLARARRAPAGGAPPSRARARRTGARGRRAADRRGRPPRPPRGRGGPPHPDRVRAAGRARPQPRAADDAPRAAHRGVGPGLRRRHRDAAHPHRQPAAQDRARRRRAALHPHRRRRRLPLRRLSVFTRS